MICIFWVNLLVHRFQDGVLNSAEPGWVGLSQVFHSSSVFFFFILTLQFLSLMASKFSPPFISSPLPLIHRSLQLCCWWWSRRNWITWDWKKPWKRRGVESFQRNHCKSAITRREATKVLQSQKPPLSLRINALEWQAFSNPAMEKTHNEGEPTFPWNPRP